MKRLTLAQARRIAIRAQHLDTSSRSDTRADVAAMVRKMGVLQIDTVNILARAHYLPLYSRLGPYDTALLDAAASKSPRLIVEQWGHEACFVPPSTHRLLAGFRRRWSSGDEIEQHPGAEPLAERIAQHLQRTTATAQQVGAWLAAQELSPAEEELVSLETNFDWSRKAVKVVLENLFDADILASAGRTHHFHRIYGAREKVLPPSFGAISPPERSEAIAELTTISLDKVGIGTPATIADFFRLRMRDVLPIINTLVRDGRAIPVEVPGLKGAVMSASVPVPRSVAGTAFLSPFDPLIFERRRAEALFGLDYRIGIYTPAEKRTRGYYSLPLLHDGAIPARADLALDRKTAALRVMGAWYEPGHESSETDPALTGELQRFASWLAADRISVADEAPGDAVSGIRALV